MRALAGPAMLLVMAGGYLVFRLSTKEVAPLRDFTQLEFAGADQEHTGTCYSLDSVLIANRARADSTRTWVSPRKDVWTLKLDQIVQANGGPVRMFQEFTFERFDEQVRLTSIAASKGLPTDVGANIDMLIDAPHEMNSTPVDRCRTPGATGYDFTPGR